MSITRLPDADFTPTRGDYKDLKPFRFWCQKVLPLVYDDSLSYYELLCKVVDYLNKTMEDVETLNDDVANLHTAYTELQSYVNNYFRSLDVQVEINNKLDTMASDGSLSALINPLIPASVTNWLNENVNPVGSAVVVDSTLSISGAAGDAKAIGDKFAETLYNKGNIPAGLDLNTGDFIHPGRWALIDIANKPENWGSPNIGTLICFATSSGSSVYTFQVICDYYNDVYYRVSYYNGSWRPWVKIANNLDISKVLTNKGNIPAGLDLNTGDFIHPGRWALINYADKPDNWGAPNIGTLICFASETDSSINTFQVICDYYNNIYYRMSYINGSWRPWVKLADESVVTALEELTAKSLINKGNIPAGLDLNTGDFIHPGRWALITVDNKPENWGSPYIGTLVCFASETASSVNTFQVICDYYDNIYYRMSYINGLWRPWVKLADDSVVAKAAVSMMWKNMITDASLDINKGEFVKPGIWSVSSASNMPKNWGSPFIGKLMSYSSDSDSSATTYQQIVDYYNNFYYRYSTTNGIWNDWNNLRSGLYTHRNIAFKPIFTNFEQFKNNYSIPVHTAGASGNVSALYTLYDGETATGISITKTSFGKDSSGIYDIYRYHVSKNTGSKPIVLVVIGEHSNEMNSAMVGYYAYKEVVNGALTQYLDYVDFVFIPMLSPWGYENNSRNNYNGVNINRDFPAMWSYSADEHNTTGDTSMSQIETQYIINYVLANKDKIIFAVNKHDTGTISRKINGTEEDLICYLSSNMATDRTINNGVCSQQNAQVRTTDAWIIDDCIGYDISKDMLTPSVSYQLPGSMDLFFNSVGIHGSLLEVSYRAYDDSDTTQRYNAPHDADLRRLGLDFFINYLSSTLEHCDLLLSNDETVKQTQRYFSRKQVDGNWQNIELAFNRYSNTFAEM